MNKTCTRIHLPPQIFRPRLITPHVPATQTKAGSVWRSGKPPALSGYTRRLGSQRTRVCAWLERGGIYNSTLMPHQQPRAFLQSRMHCSPQAPQSPGSLLGDNDPTRWGSGPNACSPVWADYDDPRAVTFKWIGTDDIRFYEFQLHTCGNLYSPLARPCCKENDLVAFELQQRGTWLYLNEFHCRCSKPAEIREITYARPIPPSNRAIQPLFISMTCQIPPVCASLATPCFYEVPNAEGLLVSGIYVCQCPRRYFCDAYHMRRPRVHATTNTGQSIYFTFCKLSFF
ncbi:unnamed protein product [Hymenolepis diminuta]|uniref:DUF5731 domain-containing protein n=2 Tax=Hymenolepis diminuta TaxID=6216 RepID=A0A0R3SFN8_HYMDI|nr:unnamed protein product [Hymenolepis diminuta]